MTLPEYPLDGMEVKITNDKTRLWPHLLQPKIRLSK